MNDLETGSASQPSVSLPDWGVDYRVGYCTQCDWRFLVADAELPATCPHCFQAKVEQIVQADLPPIAEMIRLPELYLPFTLSTDHLNQKLDQFATGLPFAPADLNLENMHKRLQWIWLPVWLIDSEVRADWQAEAGFNYQVKSHEERYGDGEGWKTKEVIETRQRWEPRLGRLERSYQNVTSQALDVYQIWIKHLGKYEFAKSKPYAPEAVFPVEARKRAVVCLPDRSQVDAWPDAVPAFQALASAECREACGADHLRDFHWKPEFHHQNWSLLLLPAISTFYIDDDNQPQQVLIHGQTGKLSGIRKASLRRAQAMALTILMAALLIFGLSLCLGAFSTLSPALLPLAGVGVVLALFVALGAIYPIAVVWMINRKTSRS